MASTNNTSRPRVWVMRDGPYENQKAENHTEPEPTFVDFEEILELGIRHWRISGSEDDPVLLQVKKDYDYSDVCEVDPVSLGEEYDSLTQMFFSEHYHLDDQVRYVMDGKGYFDIGRGYFDIIWLNSFGS